MSSFDEKYPNARAKTGKPWWRPGLRSISQDGLDLLGIDDEGAVFWDGKPLKVGKRLDLTWAQGWAPSW